MNHKHSTSNTTTLTLRLVRETAHARLYENAAGKQQWIPRSVCDRTFKYPPEPNQLPLHDVTIKDWWLAKNPWPKTTQKELPL